MLLRTFSSDSGDLSTDSGDIPNSDQTLSINDDDVAKDLELESHDSSESIESKDDQQILTVIEADDDFLGNQALKNLDIIAVSSDNMERHNGAHAFELAREGKVDEVTSGSVVHYKSSHTGETISKFENLPGEFHHTWYDVYSQFIALASAIPRVEPIDAEYITDINGRVTRACNSMPISELCPSESNLFGKVAYGMAVGCSSLIPYLPCDNRIMRLKNKHSSDVNSVTPNGSTIELGEGVGNILEFEHEHSSYSKALLGNIHEVSPSNDSFYLSS